MVDDKTFNKLTTLEESLWVGETRFNNEYMESILADDFFEFGRSGRVYNREQCLSAKGDEIKAKLPLRNFQVRNISPDTFLVTYISEVQYEELEMGNRSSIWVKDNDGYKLCFHQGTITAS